MKKIHLRAGAVLIAASIFFGTIYYKPVEVKATGLEVVVGWTLLTIASTALGYVVTESVLEPVSKKLGWTSADIQVDENGNVILSQAQMEELKQAIKEYTTDENGNDKYGMYLYESTKGYNSVEAAMAAQTYDLSKEWNRGLLSHSTGHIWVSYSPSVASGNATFAPNGAVWISLGLGYMVHFYNANGLEPVYIDNWYFQNNKHTWSVNNSVSGSAGAANIYGGPGHVAFETIEDYRAYIKDGSPYTLVAPTYTGGNLVITPDDLKNPDNPNNPDNPGEDGEEDTSTELGVLQAILKWVKKIYNQVVVGNVINAVDAVAQVMETVKVYLDEGLEDAAAVAGLVDELGTKFPFSLPQDILLVLTVFEAEPQAPVWKIPFRADFGGPTGMKIDEEIEVDFAQFEDAVNVLKWFMGIIWIWGLVTLTPKVLGIGNDSGGGMA